MRKIYSYIFYRTYLKTPELHKENAISRTSRFLSVLLFINLISIVLLFEKTLVKEYFYLVISICAIISFLNLNYLSSRNSNIFIQEAQRLSVKSYWNILIDYYPHISILFFLFCTGSTIEIFLSFLGLYLLYRFVLIAIKF